MADVVLANMAHEVDVGRAATEGKIDMVELGIVLAVELLAAASPKSRNKKD